MRPLKKLQLDTLDYEKLKQFFVEVASLTTHHRVDCVIYPRDGMAIEDGGAMVEMAATVSPNDLAFSLAKVYPDWLVFATYSTAKEIQHGAKFIEASEVQGAQSTDQDDGGSGPASVL